MNLLLLSLVGCVLIGKDDVTDAYDPDQDGLTWLDGDCDPYDPSVGSAPTWYADTDGDGYGDPAATTTACDRPSGYSADQADCDDADSAVHPGAPETCDGRDEDCDGIVDEDATDPVTWYADSDGDGFGNPSAPTLACDVPEGHVSDESDCDDTNDTIHPGAAETCNGGDDDCDDAIDEDAPTWYADTDADGFGDAASTTAACDTPDGYVLDASDCDDSRASVNPAAEEICNGVDDDCDDAADEDAIDRATWYADLDGDGCGDAAAPALACEPPDDHVSDASDCDDTRASVYPGAPETCNDVDDDCDESVDEDATDPSTWYADADADGYGDAISTAMGCDAPEGRVADATDCDDANDAIHPGASEICNGLDDDCDDAIDEDAPAWYADADGDGFGDAASPTVACDLPEGAVADASDCDDTVSTVFPGAPETCDGIDNDCDSAVDESDAVDAPTWYLDADGDGFGVAEETLVACTPPLGWADNGRDDDDADPASPNPWDHDVAWIGGDGHYLCSMGSPMPTSVAGGSDKFVAAWVRFDVGDTGGGLLDVNPWEEDSEEQGGFGLSATTTEVTWHRSSSGGAYLDSHAFATESVLTAEGDWHLVEAYCDDAWDGYVLVQVDGVSVGSQSVSWCHGNNPAVAPLIGARLTAEGYVEHFTGFIAEMTVTYGTVENDPTPGVGLATSGSTIAHWVPGEGGLVDETGHGNDCVWIAEACATWYADTDRDGYGDAAGGVTACDEPEEYVADGSDCDDANEAVHPGAAEICNGLDEDCSGIADDGLCGVLDTSSAVAVIRGAASGDATGNPISAAGDVNGDGWEDVLLGSYGTSTSVAPAYAVLGPLSGFYDLPERAAPLTTYTWEGVTITGVGDVTDDGFDDILVGEPRYADRNGLAGLYMGPVTVGMEQAPAFSFSNESRYDSAGAAVAGAGDLDDDGYADLLVGSIGYETSSNNGRVYLLSGPITTSLGLADAGFKLTGTRSMDCAGNSLAGGRDVSGDGVPDVIVGASHESTAFTYSGAAYVVLGPVTADRTLSSAEGMWLGTSGNGNVGFNIRWAGDVNGDGLEDILVPNGAEYRTTTEGAFLVLGPGTGLHSLADADAVFHAETVTDYGGYKASAGDIDGDGAIDLAFAAVYATSTDTSSGRAYVFFAADLGAHDLVDADAIIDGPSESALLGRDVEMGADATGDGLPDLILGAAQDEGDDENAGAVFVFSTVP